MTGTADYAAFGQIAGTTGTSAEPYLYAGAWGYRSDGDAGLMLVGARYHDAQAGRFVTRDTLLGEHPYLYCEHEPVGSVDPSGHEDNPIAAVTLGGITVVPEPGRPGDHWAPPGFSLLVPWLPALPVVGFPPREPPILIIHLPPMVIPRPPRLPRPGFPPPRLIVEPILFVGGDRDGGAGGKVTITF